MSLKVFMSKLLQLVQCYKRNNLLNYYILVLFLIFIYKLL